MHFGSVCAAMLLQLLHSLKILKEFPPILGCTSNGSYSNTSDGNSNLKVNNGWAEM